MELTDQQRRVVNHNEGPALVFAVAGAGKTTAMVYRIERLVHEEIFAPTHILATSFGRSNIRDLRRGLQRWPHCARVATRTLHSLGLAIIKRALRHGHLRHLRLNAGAGAGNLQQQLLDIALYEARRNNVPYKRELNGLDRQDFLSYVGYCKGNLQYADLRHAGLPSTALQTASQAQAPQAPLEWYLDLYRLFERIRRRQGWVTFDDMLLTAWQALVSYPEVLEEVCHLYQSVLVDEFQDINLAQSEILHLITQPHRNYMAIGDDDQTIYEWRGANPQFILDFPKRYDAQTYLISDNFRCPAAPLVLANEVIAHNRKRQPKRLSLTRGFAGDAQVLADRDVAAMSHHIVDKIEAMAAAGRPLNEIAVLVRLNAQTPYIEQNLIARRIPYRVSKPFYDRPEIRTLIHYGRLAWIEQRMAGGHFPLAHARTRARFNEAWRNVCNRPKRYLSRDLREQIRQAVIQKRIPLNQAVYDASQAVPQDWLRDRLLFLAEDLVWLSQNLNRPATLVLRELEARLAYRDFLREASGFPQTGEGRAASVTAFIEYAGEQGTLMTFMQHIRRLADKRIGQDEMARGDAVTLSTIHQAKGLEWPVIFVAQCNKDTIPFDAPRTADMEEERRLFYVAITRTRQELHLHAVQNQLLSQFLLEANWHQLLPTVRTLGATLARPPETWQAAEALALARQIPAFHLQRYFHFWTDGSKKEEIGRVIQRFFSAVHHHDLWDHLDLEPEILNWWQELAPLPDEPQNDHFPGIEDLLPQSLLKKLRDNLRI